LGGVAENVAGGIGGDGVAALEGAKRAAFLELEAKAIEAFAFFDGGRVRTERPVRC